MAAKTHAKDTTGNTLRIAQINARNARAVMDELRVISTGRNLDILSIQEPYNNPRGSNTCNMGLITTSVFDHKPFSSVKSLNLVKSAIAIPNRTLTVLKIEQFCNSHFTCIHLTRPDLNLYLVNAYFQFSENIQKYLDHLSLILDALKGKNVLITLDANAKSVLWFSDSSDDRGQDLEDLISQYNLFILNKPSTIPTYSSESGSSNIDLTLASQTCLTLVQNWQILDHDTSSDHNILLTTLSLSTPLPHSNPKQDSTSQGQTGSSSIKL